jgi:hypothetical protein
VQQLTFQRSLYKGGGSGSNVLPTASASTHSETPIATLSSLRFRIKRVQHAHLQTVARKQQRQHAAVTLSTLYFKADCKEAPAAAQHLKMPTTSASTHSKSPTATLSSPFASASNAYSTRTCK